MELRHLRYFLAVAEEGNFTRAAGKLGIGQPPLSQQIRDLEREVGATLFHRVPHGAELTAAGTAFLGEAKASLAAAEKAKLAAQSANRGETGRLSLGFTASSAFNPVVSTTIRRFRAYWPEVQLSLTEMNTLALMQKLERGELDATFMRPSLDDLAGIRMRRLPDEPMVIALPASHPLAQRSKLPLAALADQPFILFPRLVGLSLYDDVVLACRKAGFELTVAQEAPQISSVVNLVAAELGVSIVPASISQIKLEGVAYRPIEGPPAVARLALAILKTHRSPVTENLISLLSS
ncbi:LysR family transcriptional regulator [Rhizobium laguerreae]|uniref:HTH-type transcriptional regulator TtuA n=1 Tax=Rhizobium laguerreae TaxID=1076926 RepID=A0AB35F9Z9_9HYPH|nr:LysR family transcriptional regulator [Rhizobium laguerreae]MBY3062391.1 LysR family transcriptional regulator [Rhizobium laguerreae]MBY3077228.1 LysR family transcriptional regulator [Rhizobium laguerreae]MBY3112432.1 LysR family transcriptional regulator [Rhizobium laguerreae]MBY3138513.1 LysR family transcriptional regulator [Rhizobium laguerreae]MBY3201802.1 LysR family transcriptional regulator [Rhizobium laguerreae]